MRSALALLAFLALPPGLACAQSAGQWSNSEKLWNATCRYCHQANGSAPVLFGGKLSVEAIAILIRNGINGMPGFLPTQVRDEEVLALARWIVAQPAPAKP
jgi:mono/diheme cytochrome c family protein